MRKLYPLIAFFRGDAIPKKLYVKVGDPQLRGIFSSVLSLSGGQSQGYESGGKGAVHPESVES